MKADEGVHGDLGLGGQGVAGGQHHRQLVLAEGDDVHPGAGLRVGHQAQVGGAEDDVVVDLVGAPVVEAEVHLGVRPQQLLLDVVQLVEADRVDAGDVAGPGDLGGLLADLLLHLREAGQDLLAAAEQPLAGGRGRHLPRAAREQPLLVAILERADLLADRRLGDVVELRGARERTGLDHVDEHLQGLELHERASLPLSRVIRPAWV
jgi:hypothetical protein